MNMRLVALCFLFAVSFAICNREAKPVITSERLNVLLITLDDLNTSLGCYGNPIVKTPNIDRLAGQSVRFNRAYSQFSLCNPSRTSFLSGRRPETTGVLANKTPSRIRLRDEAFLPEHFRNHGYFTARVGKIAHDRQPDPITWDFAKNVKPPKEPDPPCPPRKPGWCPKDTNDQDEPDGIIARQVVSLLRENRERTFFIAAGFGRPHGPWFVPRKYFDLYPVKSIPLPQGKFEDGMTKRERREARAAYYASVSFVDAQIELILDALDELDLSEKTIIILTSDHGFHLGEHGVWDKKTLFEEVARVPLIISVPGKPAGITLSQMVELVDLYPTLTALCGLPTPDGLEGTSFVPLLSDPSLVWKKAVFTSSIRSKRSPLEHAVRTDRYVYMERDDGTLPRLFDRKSDPGEVVNLADNPAHQETLASMKRLLEEGWRAAVPVTNQ